MKKNKKNGWEILSAIAFIISVSGLLFAVINSGNSLELKMSIFNLIGIVILIVLFILDKLEIF
jgi:hypothetical protein